jgi:hypothetical protein
VNNSQPVHTLFDLYMIGPFESIFIAIAISNNRGESMIIHNVEPIRSNILLTIIDHQSNFECLYSSAIIF